MAGAEDFVWPGADVQANEPSAPSAPAEAPAAGAPTAPGMVPPMLPGMMMPGMLPGMAMPGMMPGMLSGANPTLLASMMMPNPMMAMMMGGVGGAAGLAAAAEKKEEASKVESPMDNRVRELCRDYGIEERAPTAASSRQLSPTRHQKQAARRARVRAQALKSERKHANS
ncbi:hypothetical protein AK812_SmicGene43392 [Symbiodinium microadriaticum]|uniref:Uncharacterized protein n=1 Tax=Symbiodinium microadriaticum TaxID=2951 RepID=A0A1Q9C155_SYMMI|nr:hypothetical protein AK812_SmicGene43392 [Symbiodinium microadriaticum]